MNKRITFLLPIKKNTKKSNLLLLLTTNKPLYDIFLIYLSFYAGGHPFLWVLSYTMPFSAACIERNTDTSSRQNSSWLETWEEPALRSKQPEDIIQYIITGQKYPEGRLAACDFTEKEETRLSLELLKLQRWHWRLLTETLTVSKEAALMSEPLFNRHLLTNQSPELDSAVE